MPKKDKLIRECAKLLLKPKIKKWYDDNLLGNTQADTIVSLEYGVSHKQISVKEALMLALLVGYEWKARFEEEGKQKK